MMISSFITIIAFAISFFILFNHGVMSDDGVNDKPHSLSSPTRYLLRKSKLKPRCPESFDKLNPKDPIREKEIYQSMVEYASKDLYVRESMIQSGRISQNDNEKEMRIALNDKIISIPILFHLFTSTKRRSVVGNVPLAAFQAQVNVMNAAYSSVGIQFTLFQVKTYENSDYFKGYSLGFSTFPWFYPETSKLHGVVMSYKTLPPAKGYKPFAAYNEGDTLVHEVGHFFGLYHTFQGGCSDQDFVSDTPAEDTPAYGKPCLKSPPRDTCSTPGVDPVTNYMDYTNDICLTQFSPLQRARMRTIMLQYKPTMTNG